MKVFARFDCVADLPSAAGITSGNGPVLLLEGVWPQAQPHQWSLDESIDARQAWIDDEASSLAESLSAFQLAYLNQLKLRYYFVKLLRPVAFFERHGSLFDGTVELHVRKNRDEDYVDLFRTILRAWPLNMVWHPAKVDQSAARAPSKRWRALAARVNRWARPRRRGGRHVVLFGNRKILNPVCGELLRRECRVTWLYQQFAAGTWLQWRGQGVGQWSCDGDPGVSPANIVAPAAPWNIASRGIDLTEPVRRWLETTGATRGAHQSQTLASIQGFFAEDRPDLLVMDEDATPFPRAAIAVARQHGIRSAIIQHGVPRVKFGFAPLAADDILVWGESSKLQLQSWGVEADRIHVTGSPQHDQLLRQLSPGASVGGEEPPRIVFFATVPPDDARPDAVSFHLTSATHVEMLRTTCAAIDRLSDTSYAGLRLTIQLHPRCRDDRVFRQVLAEFPGVKATVVAAKGNLAQRLAGAACVINCTSSAGIDATLAGLPVIELIPRGSLDLMPAAQWGTFGTARTEEELTDLLELALACAPRQRVASHAGKDDNGPFGDAKVFANLVEPATPRVVDCLLTLAKQRRDGLEMPSPEEVPCRV